MARSVEAVAAGAIALLAAASVAAQVPTPEADTFVIDLEEGNLLVVGLAEHLTPKTRIGLVFECKKAEQALKATLFFAGFPDGRNVQTAVRAADGTVGRFGPVVRGSRAAGFHSPAFHDSGDVLKLLDLAFTEGSLISNGYNSIWNRIPEDENALARQRLRSCAEGR